MDRSLKQCACGIICGLEIEICPLCLKSVFHPVTMDQLMTLPGPTIKGYFDRMPEGDWHPVFLKNILE
ncbi:MAG: hypothetical protein Q7R53_00135 [bacterium]|nr:hypothetical protein [bacterium]